MNYLKDPRQYNRVSRILSLLFWALTTTVQAQDYTYTTNNGTITIIRYTGVGGEVTVPGQHKRALRHDHWSGSLRLDCRQKHLTRRNRYEY